MNRLTRGQILAHLIYQPATGAFRWRKSKKPAGSYDCDGYLRIALCGGWHKLHRIAFFLVNGRWPQQVDHKDLIRDNNRARNLRAATRAQNQRNKGLQKNNSTGVKGVYLDAATGRFRAQIYVNGKKQSVGTHPTLAAAEQAIRRAREKLHGSFANHG